MGDGCPAGLCLSLYLSLSAISSLLAECFSDVFARKVEVGSYMRGRGPTGSDPPWPQRERARLGDVHGEDKAAALVRGPLRPVQRDGPGQSLRTLFYHETLNHKSTKTPATKKNTTLSVFKNGERPKPEPKSIGAQERGNAPPATSSLLSPCPVLPFGAAVGSLLGLHLAPGHPPGAGIRLLFRTTGGGGVRPTPTPGTQK